MSGFAVRGLSFRARGSLRASELPYKCLFESLRHSIPRSSISHKLNIMSKLEFFYMM